MEAIRKLQAIGYRVELDGENIRLTYAGGGRPNPATVRPLLEELKRRKAEAVAHLRGRPCWFTRDGACFVCGERRFWLSVYGILVCATCHPPAAPELVAEWVETTMPQGLTRGPVSRPVSDDEEQRAQKRAWSM